MRSLGLSLCLVACTLENPAFFASQTDGTATAASAATDSGGAMTGAPTTSTATSTSGPDATSIAPGTTEAATGMNVSDTVATTDAPGTTSTTDPSMTASSEPGSTSTSSSTSGEPMMCAAFDDPLGPYLQLLALPGYLPVTTDACAPSQEKVIGGRLFADASGFSITKDVLCQPDILLVAGLHFPVPLPPEIPGKGQCVKLTFLAHTEYEDCKISTFQVTLNEQPVLLGSFGLSQLPNALVDVAIAPKGVCACPECCGAEFPDPDLYKMVVAGAAVPEGSSAEIQLMGLPYLFTNLRGHVHSPECTSGDLHQADWLHLDWVVARLP